MGAVVDALEVELSALAPAMAPTRAEQLAVSGAIIMADWIASGPHFDPVDDAAQVTMAAARARADRAWQRLALRGGWNIRPWVPVGDLVAMRFGRASRACQAAAIELARALPVPGLMMIEAPMGEGKTEAALAVAEVLARRFGADGVFVGMPTQATCDPMFIRLLDWVRQVQADTAVGLLHGKRRFNRRWRELCDGVSFTEVFDELDEYGCTDDFGSRSGQYPNRPSVAPAEWFLGPKRGLLIRTVVATVDQLLHAATRTRHVMLRHTGLVGRVVILDEVHAYDVYMSQFLCEALRWLANAAVPVVLLSATLPAPMRRQLATAYLQGALQLRDVQPPGELVTEASGYPVVRVVWVEDGQPRYDQRVSQSWRLPLAVGVKIAEDRSPDDAEAVVSLLTDALADGGCALVVRNTVGRAQHTYRLLADSFGADEVVLLHSRFTAAERADRTERVLDLLGAPDRDNAPARPPRLIVVATQVAEQSFDVDVDLLVTDLAPIDLLLQRVGRLHRHTRPCGARPERVATPTVVVAGMATRANSAPTFPPGCEHIYGRHLLLRAAALAQEAADGQGWQIPADVPALVQRGYADDMVLPPTWRGAAAEAQGEWARDQTQRAGNAKRFLLAGDDQLGTPTLAGLHERHTRDLSDDDAVAAVVRDGPESVEVLLVRRDDRGYRTLTGRPIGVAGEAVSDPDIAEEVVGSAMRLPPRPELTTAAKANLRPLPECGNDPWLRRAPVLELDADNRARLGGRLLTYDPTLGLLDEQAP